MALSDIDPAMPVLVGAGQTVVRSAVASGQVPHSPADLAGRAAQAALADAGGKPQAIAQCIDVVAAIRLFSDSAPAFAHAFGGASNLPRAVARRIGAEPVRAIYSSVGGQNPQRLVTELADLVHRGEARMALLCGAEAAAATRQARRAGLTFSWDEEVPGQLEDRAEAGRLASGSEIAHGLAWPAQAYALIEQAQRHAAGQSAAQRREMMARLFAPFSAVAAANAYAQFPVAHDAAFLAAPSQSNYPLNSVYLRHMIAQDAVNQAAAVLLTSVGEARRLGIPPEKWMFLHGSGDADDVIPSERADLSRSVAMEAALGQALDTAELSAEQIDLIDIYSCFPCAVLAVVEALGWDWRAPPCALTLTGGLPFFGGPGNNYSLHGIAEMVSALRRTPDAYGMVTANGGMLSKHAVGVYSARPPARWSAGPQGTAQARADAAAPRAVSRDPAGAGRIDSYVVMPGPDKAPLAGIFGTLAETGERFIAVSADPATCAALDDTSGLDAFGRIVQVKSGKPVNSFSL